MKNVLWRVYGYLRPYWRLVAGAYLALLGILGLNMSIPLLIGRIIDDGIRAGQLSALTWPVLALLGLALVRGLFTYFQGMWSEVASQNVAYDLRNEIQRKLTLLSFSFHDQTETGELLSRAIQDVERIRFLTGRATLRILDGVLMLVVTAIVLLTMQFRLALLVVAFMPLLAYQAYYFGRRFRPLSLDIQKQLAILTTQVEQNLRGARVVKAFAQEDAEIDHFERQNNIWLKLSILATRLQSINIPLLFLIANFGTVFIIWYGGRQVVRGEFSLGELVAFTTYLAQLIDPVRRLGMIIPAVAIASSAAERIFEILDIVPEVHDAPDAYVLPAIQGQVRFEKVSFTYVGGSAAWQGWAMGNMQEKGLPAPRMVIREIDFEVQPGQMVALLGPTGSGKSTIINLLPRFYDPTAGRVLVDGHDLRQVTMNSLRSQIGMVMQETVLFAGTIRENIAFGRPEASEDEIIEAARAAQAHDFILQTAQGYDTRVGERGVTLSGGQKQRLAIARALLMDPRILILDDAMAAVDTGTERLIQLAFDRLMQGRTTFVIAHRLSTVRKADMILVLEKGRIAARGTHQSLLHTSRLYAEIYQRQLKPQEGSLALAGTDSSVLPREAGQP